jgi:hypothetical protein
MILSLNDFNELNENLNNIQLSIETQKEYGIDKLELPAYTGRLSIKIRGNEVHINAAKKRMPFIGGDKIKHISHTPNNTP